MDGRKLGLKTKIIMIYISLILVPLTAVLIVFSAKSIKEMKDNYVFYMEENNAQLQLRIKALVTDAERVYHLQSLDQKVQNILSKTTRSYGVEYINDVKTMNNFIVSSSRLGSFYFEVVYVGMNGECYTGANYMPNNQEQIPLLISELRALKGKNYFSSIYTGLNGNDYLSVNRMLIKLNTLKENGFLFICMKVKDIQRYFTFESAQTSSNMAIMNDKEIIFLAQNTDSEISVDNQVLVNVINANWTSIENGITVIKIGEEPFQVVGTINPETGWKVVQYVPTSVINKYARSSVYFYMIAMIPIFLLIIVLGYFLSSRIILPIERLKAAMQRVAEGIFVEVKDFHFREDEMGSLVKSYNCMVGQLEESIKQNYVAKLNQKRIEFEMLEAQINPHFLYNTLSLISSISEIGGLEEVTMISNSLSDMFRYNVQKGSIVYVKEELDQIRNYMNIQKYRFLGKIRFECFTNSEIDNYRILKFLLQPLVENALYHGIEKKEASSLLTITFLEENERLYITIEDDGVGMSDATLEELKDKLNQKESYFNQDHFEHIGIQNVYSRIKLYYGEEYGLEIWSELNIGTRIQITIPIVKEV